MGAHMDDACVADLLAVLPPELLPEEELGALRDALVYAARLTGERARSVRLVADAYLQVRAEEREGALRHGFRAALLAAVNRLFEAQNRRRQTPWLRSPT
ncbi:MAG: hypothetical protein ACJ72E_13235 [Marmoricola sp.]